MAKRPPIMLGSKRLHECRIDEIVDIASHPLRKRFDERPYAPHYMNRSIIRAFAGADERTTSELIAKYPEGSSDWSDEFNALRVGEALGWALHEGIVERVVERGRVHQHRWRLLHAEPQFENIGRGPRKRSIRTLNAGDLQPDNNRLWARELKTRERLRRKYAEEFKPAILRSIAIICRSDPNHDISSEPHLSQFAVGGFATIASCRELIEQSLDDLTGEQLMDAAGTLSRICRRLDIDERRSPPPPPSPAELDNFSL